MTVLARLRLHPLTILGAALFSLATPVFGLAFLAWVCLVPFLIAVERQRSWRGALAQGLWLSVLTSFGVYYWIPPAVTEFHATSAWVPWLLFPLYGVLAQPQLIIYALVRWAWRGRHDLATAMASALLYTGFDWLAPKMFVDTIGQMFFDNLVLIQVIDLGGIYLLTFVLVLVNESAYAAVVHRMRSGATWASLRPLTLRFAVAGALVAAVIGYGLVRGSAVRAAQEQPRASFRAALIQANVGNFDKVASEQGDLEAVTSVLQSYVRLTDRQAQSDAPPDVIIWPETAYPLAYGASRTSVDQSIDADLRAYVNARNMPLLFGGYHVVDGREYNSALVVDPSGEHSVYHKNILLPFGEYLPVVDDWTWLRDKLSNMPRFGVGGTPRVIDIPLASGTTIKAAPIICYEALFAEHAIAGANAGGQVLVNLTNDAWFGSVAEKKLHLAMSALRSVETRRPQLRATNTGISALILPDGEIVNPGPVDAEASLVYAVPVVDLPPTPIMRLGPWAGPASLAAGALLALILFAYRRRRAHA